jgi:hypothetical protein
MLSLLIVMAEVIVVEADLMAVVLCWRVVLALAAGFGAAALVHAMIPKKDVGMVVGAHIALAGLVIGLIWQGKEPELKS